MFAKLDGWRGSKAVRKRLNGFSGALAVATGLSVLYLGVLFALGLERGLSRTAYVAATESEEDRALHGVTTYIGCEALDKVRRDAGLPPVRFYQWTGIWKVSRETTYEIHASADDHVVVTFDGRLVLRSEGDGGRQRILARVTLAKGPHSVAVGYTHKQAITEHLALSWAADGSEPRPFGQADLYPHRQTLRAYESLAPFRWVILLSWLAVPILGVLAFARSGAGNTVWKSQISGRAAVIAGLLACVLAYAVLLRFEALVVQWGPIPGSADAMVFQRRVASVVRHIRPDAMDWRPSPYPPGGDPYDYLQQARERSGFFAGHLREPLFVFAIKPVLRLLGQADVAGLVTSLVFSTLLVLSTFFLGSYAFSPWVGLAAALAVSIDSQVVGQAVAGHGDDAFAFFVVLTTYAAIRLREQPGAGRAAFWALAGGGATLTRLTALSFIVPTAALSYWTKKPRSAWLKSSAFGLIVFVGLVGPFLVNCWIEFGNPLYPVTGLRGYWEWNPTGQHRTGWFWYFIGRLAAQPVGFLDTTFVSALDVFQKQWGGLSGWLPSPLVTVLSSAAVVGLAGFCWFPRGRFLLLLLGLSAAPYLFIRDMPFGTQYRFTLHLYPLFLIAAFAAIAGGIRAVTTLRLVRVLPERLQLRSLALKTCITGGLLASGWTTASVVLPYWRMREELRQGRQTIVAAGPRDRLFFRAGWHVPTKNGNVTARFSRGRNSTVWVPILWDQDVTLIVRLDPFAFENAAPQAVRIAVNGTHLSTFTLQWNPERFGTYNLEVPRQIIRTGLNRIDLSAAYSTLVGSVRQLGLENQPPLPADLHTSFRLWYVHVITKTQTT